MECHPLCSFLPAYFKLSIHVGFVIIVRWDMESFPDGLNLYPR